MQDGLVNKLFDGREEGDEVLGGGVRDFQLEVFESVWVMYFEDA